MLVSFGFDDDTSGVIEDHENMVEDCQQDNTTQYFADGSGQSRDNQEICQSTSDSEFEWKFVDNEKAIEIYSQRYDLHRLSKDELYFIIQVQGLNAPAHDIYRKL